MSSPNAARATATLTATADCDAACRAAMNLQLRGRLELAAQAFRAILRAESGHAMTNHCLGMLHVQMRRPADALPFLLTALNESPQVHDYWLGYLEALLQDGRIDTAAETLVIGRQHGLSGNSVEAFAQRLARRETAHPLAREDAAPSSRDDASSSSHGTALLKLMAQRRFKDASALARSMTERFPEHGLGWKVFGALLWSEGYPEAALTAMRTSTRLLPQDAEAHSNLGIALASLKRFDEAEVWLRRALAIDPGFAPAHYRLGMYYELQARYEESESSLRAAKAARSGPLTTDDEHGYSNLMYVISHNPAIGAEALFAEHREVGRLFEADVRAAWPRHSNPRDPERRLKIGFVSGDFRDHSVAVFLEPVVSRLARRPGLDLHGFYNYAAEDRVTTRLRGHFAQWHPIAPLTDAELAQRIRDAGIDILVDLSGHTAENRLRTFARKPAPVQVSWLGYPGTTGLEAMDYYLADRLWLPAGQFDHRFTEKLAYLPDRWAFAPHPDAPAVSALPALETGRLTFGSFHRPGKVNSSMIRLWSDLLATVPRSTLLVASITLRAQQDTLLERFAAHGIAAERLRFEARCAMDRYLGLHRAVDIALDAHPYSGATTTMHSLSMGVPTLTVAGSTAASRACAGILSHVELDGFIAADAAEFVEKGNYWANHLPELADIRAGLRARLDRAPGSRPELIAAHVEHALRHMWRRWCAALPAASFHSAEVEARA